MSKTKTNPIGRPQTVLPIIRKNSLLFISKTPREIVNLLFSELQPKMRGGVTDDPKVIRRQKVSAYQQVIQYKKQAKEDGKTGIDFKGRIVNGVLKKSWIHVPKKDE
jgi:hypothetical protein